MEFDLYLLSVKFTHTSGNVDHGRKFALLPAGGQMSYDALCEMEMKHLGERGFHADVTSFNKLSDVVYTESKYCTQLLSETELNKLLGGISL